jgi:hypothetical protein
MTRVTTVDDYKLGGNFEAVRKTLLDPKFADRWEKPLAYWALPTDRRLPLAFLGRTVGDLLNTPYGDLLNTPGVGHKKIHSMIKLLHRAAKDPPLPTQFALHEPPDVSDGNGASGNGHADLAALATKFDPGLISEAHWVSWRETVVRHGLQDEVLGRLAPSLQALPTVIWRTPLSFYTERSLQEMRTLKTHGEKRIRVVLEIFFEVHQILGAAPTRDQFSIRLQPRRLAQMENWIDQVLGTVQDLSVEDVCENVGRPLLEQIRIDAGAPIYELAAGRLGIGDTQETVRIQSRRLGVTRARVYQLYDECYKIMSVRWPEGRIKLRLFEDRIRVPQDASAAQTCSAIRELFFPDKASLGGAGVFPSD